MESIRRTVKRVWGYDALLPLQEEAIGSVLAGRDSIVILPTGGAPSRSAIRRHRRSYALVSNPWARLDI